MWGIPTYNNLYVSPHYVVAFLSCTCRHKASNCKDFIWFILFSSLNKTKPFTGQTGEDAALLELPEPAEPWVDGQAEDKTAILRPP